MSRPYLAIACLVAAVTLGWFAWVWQSTHLPEFDYASDRDRVLAAATKQIKTLNTIDPSRVESGLDAWLAATTGPLHDELARTREADIKKIRKSATKAIGKVSAAAVTALDRRAGNASVIASVRITVTRTGATTSEQRKRYQAGLTLDKGEWKIKSLTAIGVDAA